MGDRWNPIARGPAVGDNHSGPVRTGTQLVVWNGTETGGIAHTPATNSWSTLPPARWRLHFAQEEEAYLSLLDHGGRERATTG